MLYFFIIVLGLVLGSFVGALSYRAPRNEPIGLSRSKCPRCKKVIAWYDNIPLLSYLMLSGKCRNCGKKISIRYPLIESFVAFLLLLVFMNMGNIMSIVAFLPNNFYLAFSIMAFFVVILSSIFVVDLEEMIIPDEIVFVGIAAAVALMVLTNSNIYMQLFLGFLLAFLFLGIVFATRGRGMGLGDVKLAIFLGVFFDFVGNGVFVLMSFWIGAAVGIILIGLGKAHLKKPIPFGPFLIIGFLTYLFLSGPIDLIIKGVL